MKRDLRVVTRFLIRRCTPVPLTFLLMFAISLERTACADPYNVAIATPPAQVSGVNPNMSINQTGTIAFVATDISDNYMKVFVDPACIPCLPQPISFFGSGRLFYGASINNAVSPQVLASDNYTSYSFLRARDAAGSGSFQLYGKTPDPYVIDFTGFGGISDSGASVDLEVQSGGTPALGRYSAYGAPRTLLGYPSGTLLRPEIAKAAGNVVATTGIKGVSDFTYDVGAAAWSARTIPGTDGSVYTNVGTSPGISNDGTVIAFAGSSPIKGVTTPQILVEISHPTTVIAGSPTVFEPTKLVIAENQEGITDLHDYVARRISVYSRIGSSFLAGNQDPVAAGAMNPGRQELFQFITIAFTASFALNGGQPVEGVYSRDLLIQLTAGSNAADSPYVFKLLRLGPITSVLTPNTPVNGLQVPLTSNFAPADTIASLTTGNPNTSSADMEVPIIALTGTDSSGKYYGFRGQRSCSLPIPAGEKVLPNWRQSDSNWKSHPMTGVDKVTGKSYTIGAVGCRLSATADVLTYLAPYLSGINPDNLSQVLKMTHFQTSGGVLAVGNQYTKVINKNGYDTEADLLYEGVNDFGEQANIPVTHDEVIERVSSDGISYVKTGPLGVTPEPMQQDNINADGLSPYLDFLYCNGIPPIIRVLNCKEYYSGTKNGSSVCKGHFVFATSKVARSVAGGANQYITSLINDPGYAGGVDLLNTFKSGDIYGNFIANRHNRFAGVEAYFPVQTMPVAADNVNKGTILTSYDQLTMLRTQVLGKLLQPYL